jgi:AP-3 complex subunit mu
VLAAAWHRNASVAFFHLSDRVCHPLSVPFLRIFYFLPFSFFSEPIIEKHWRGITSRDICDFFWNEVTKYESKEVSCSFHPAHMITCFQEVPPIISTSKYYLINVYHSGTFLLAITTGEISPLIAIEFLHRVFQIFEEYFGDIEESTIKENFATVYQVLEEMMDYGYPFTTEPNVLKAMIAPPSVLSRLTTVATGKSFVSEELPDGTLSNMPWRQTGMKYSQNEIYLDIVEEIDGVFDRNGQAISLEVSGVIMANSRLSGMPDLTLQFTDPSVIDDCSFHPCVRYNRYDRDKVVSFVPPDGQFELMRYRVNSSAFISPPCFCQPQFTHDTSKGKGHLSLVVGQKPSSSLIFPSNKGPMVVRLSFFLSSSHHASLNTPFDRSKRSQSRFPLANQ